MQYLHKSQIHTTNTTEYIMKSNDKESIILSKPGDLWNANTRRSFLRIAGLGGIAILLPSMFTACDDDKNTTPVNPDPEPDNALVINLSTDAGVLNFAYALEQLEAAYYTEVVQKFSGSNLSTEEKNVLTDIRNHEVIHRDFLALALGSAKIPNLAVDFSSVNFADRISVLDTAKKFEDGGVAAYNGAGKLLKDVNNLLVAGKIVSVEARHAAAIRDLLRPGTRDFAGDDVVSPIGLDQAEEAGFIVAGLGQFIKTKIRIAS